MARTSVLAISSIIEFFNNQKAIKKGENSFSSGHVVKFQFDGELGVMRGEVQASMKNRLYKVEICLKDDTIESCACTCPRGCDICHHMVALAFYGHYNVSITDKACSWLKKKGKEASVTAETCFASSSKSASYVPVPKEIDSGVVSTLFDSLSLCGPNLIQWVMSPEPNNQDLNLVVDVQDLIFSSAYLEATNKIKYFTDCVCIDAAKIKEVSTMTIGQSENHLWLTVKRHRLTASNFGRVLKACKRGRFPPSLFKTLAGAYNMGGIKQIQWGKTNERTAIEKFESVRCLKVERAGIYLHECGFLGATPDGLIENDGILEVKCPYKFRNELLETALQEEKNYILHFDKRMGYILNKEHDYYHQIQGQLHILNKEKCYLMLYSLKDYVIFEINRDDEWKDNISILQNFYLNHYIQYIIS